MLTLFVLGLLLSYFNHMVPFNYKEYVITSEIAASNLFSRHSKYDQLETVIQRQTFNKSIILFCTDSGYINLFLNAYYTSNLKNYKNVVVTCLDKPCYRQLAAMNIPVAIVDAEQDEKVDTSIASTWGTKEFQNKVQWKLIMLKKALEQNIRVLYIDSDIILLKDPFPIINSFDKYDIIAQRDGTICSGFMYLYPTKTTKRVIRRAIKIRPLLVKAGDQKAIITAVREIRSVKVLLLPTTQFSSGEVFFKTHSYYWDKISQNQVIIHNNFVIGTNNKLYRFKEMKLYNLDINREYSDPNLSLLTIEKWSNVFNVI